MIPLKDNIRLRQYPFITLILVQLNVLFFVVETRQGPNILHIMDLFAAVPARILNFPAYPLSPLTLLSSQFLHGGWFHLVGNMIYLWIFGRKVEGAMGPFPFLGFYLLGGALAAMIEVLIIGNAPTYIIGASGAIAAVLGAYLLFYPWARIWVWVPFVFWVGIFPVPAIIVLGFWFVLQLLNGALSLQMNTAELSGIAWWAHIGGFVGGMVVGFFLRRPLPDDWSQRYLATSKTKATKTEGHEK